MKLRREDHDKVWDKKRLGSDKKMWSKVLENIW